MVLIFGSMSNKNIAKINNTKNHLQSSTTFLLLLFLSSVETHPARLQWVICAQTSAQSNRCLLQLNFQF